MSIKRFSFAFTGLCLCLSATALPQAERHSARQEAGADARNDRRSMALRRQRQKVERLEKQLAGERRKLEELQQTTSGNVPVTMPGAAPKTAMIIWITGAHQGVNLGKKDGIRASDFLVILRRTAKGIVVKGYSAIEQLYDNDMIIAAQINHGIAPEDEVYVVNRENSPYNLASAPFWRQ